MFVITIFIDLCKAFDCVDHKLLLKKLEMLSLPPNTLKLFDSYLHCRKQFVKIGDKQSEELTVKKGVPQGSILGPILFNIFINDIFQLGLNRNMMLYADDIALTISGGNKFEAMNKANQDLDKLSKWFNCNLR